MKTIYCRFCMKVEIYYDYNTRKWLEVKNNQPHTCPTFSSDSNIPKKCTCPCGCEKDATMIGYCEGCEHGDCGVSGFETAEDLIKHTGGE